MIFPFLGMSQYHERQSIDITHLMVSGTVIVYSRTGPVAQCSPFPQSFMLNITETDT